MIGSAPHGRRFEIVQYASSYEAGSRGWSQSIVGMSDEATPFRIEVPDADLRYLRGRLRRTVRIHVNPRIAAPDPATFDDLTDQEQAALAAFEQPDLFVDEVRSFFRLVR